MKRVAVIAGLIATFACGGDAGTSPNQTAVGSWYLQSIDGVPLPADDGTYSYPAGSLLVSANGTFQESLDIHGPFDDGHGNVTVRTVTGHSNGTWTLVGSTLTMHVTAGDDQSLGDSPGFFNVNIIRVDWGDTGSAGFAYGRQ